MIQEKSNIDLLFRKQLAGSMTADEQLRLHLLLEEEANQKHFDELLLAYFQEEPTQDTDDFKEANQIKELAWQGITAHVKRRELSRSSKLWSAWLKVAAVLLLMASATIYYIDQYQTASKSPLTVASVKPGSNRAVLTSSNGTVYKLNGEKEEIIFDDNAIHYKDGGLIAQESGKEMLTLSTPRGGHYRVTLSDGTKVWLNAASSISYPNDFNTKERKVTLSGEAYFEVAHNAAKPFIVVTKTQSIKVLGTSFNVNAYVDENQTVTTLTTGSVQLKDAKGAISTTLKPGQQATFDNNIFDVAEVDVSVYDAWREGYFRFKATSLIDAMRQIDRWYDLNIDYTDMPKDVYIHASINRNRSLTSVMNALEKVTNLKFEINGRSVKLMK